jgi:hypothetical protein
MAASIEVAVTGHVARGVAGGFATFSHGSRAAAAHPARGGRVAACAARETVGGPPLNAWVGLGTRRRGLRLCRRFLRGPGADTAVTEEALRHG